MLHTAPQISSDDLRSVAGAFPSGVTVVTTRTPLGQPVGLTTNAFVSVSMDPPLFAVLVGTGSRTLEWLKLSEHFAVNFLNDGAEDVARTFASRSDDKFASVNWSEGLGGSPLLHESSLAIAECRRTELLSLGDHVMIVGEIIDVHTSDEQPLLYYRREFSALPELAPTV